jgi:hypothetical protein
VSKRRDAPYDQASAATGVRSSDRGLARANRERWRLFERDVCDAKKQALQ